MKAYVTSDISRETLTVMFEYLMVVDMILLIMASQIGMYYFILWVKKIRYKKKFGKFFKVRD